MHNKNNILIATALAASLAISANHAKSDECQKKVKKYVYCGELEFKDEIPPNLIKEIVGALKNTIYEDFKFYVEVSHVPYKNGKFPIIDYTAHFLASKYTSKTYGEIYFVVFVNPTQMNPFSFHVIRNGKKIDEVEISVRNQSYYVYETRSGVFFRHRSFLDGQLWDHKVRFPSAQKTNKP